MSVGRAHVDAPSPRRDDAFVFQILFILEEKRDGITVRETKLRIEADTIPMIDFLKKTFGKIDDPSEIWEFHR